MMEIYIKQYIYRSRYLVVINENTYVSICKYQKYKFDQPFLSFQVKNIFIGKSKICSMTEFFGALNNSNFDGNTILLDCEDSKYVYCSGLKNVLYALNGIVIIYLNIVVISVFVRTVIKIKVILNYENVLFVEHNSLLYKWR